MSREGAPTERAKTGERVGAAPAAGTPIWVGVLYFLGALGAVALAFFLGLRLAAEWFWDGAPTYDASSPLVLLWAALVLGALGVWASRRRR